MPASPNRSRVGALVIAGVGTIFFLSAAFLWDLAATAASAPPPWMMGEFEDDYGIAYSVSATEWTQDLETKLLISEWRPDARYFLARNDAANASAPGLWTRVDWLLLDELNLESLGLDPSDVAPFEWAFCYTVFDAPDEESARNVPEPDRLAPLQGCNGFPFSRMRAPPSRPESL